MVDASGCLSRLRGGCGGGFRQCQGSGCVLSPCSYAVAARRASARFAAALCRRSAASRKRGAVDRILSCAVFEQAPVLQRAIFPSPRFLLKFLHFILHAFRFRHARRAGGGGSHSPLSEGRVPPPCWGAVLVLVSLVVPGITEQRAEWATSFVWVSTRIGQRSNMFGMELSTSGQTKRFRSNLDSFPVSLDDFDRIWG